MIFAWAYDKALLAHDTILVRATALLVCPASIWSQRAAVQTTSIFWFHLQSRQLPSTQATGLKCKWQRGLYTESWLRREPSDTGDKEPGFSVAVNYLQLLCLTSLHDTGVMFGPEQSAPPLIWVTNFLKCRPAYRGGGLPGGRWWWWGGDETPSRSSR